MRDHFLNVIVAGLRRSSIQTCSKWAQTYRVCGKPFPGKYSFKYHPWMREIHDCRNEYVVAQKAAQMGVTEGALNRVFFGNDILGESCLYVLPTQDDASDFSTSRFDAAIDLSTHLQNLYSDVKNISHKRAGSANLYIRGSRAKSKLKSVPVSLIVFDEIDEMRQENIPLALERVSGQMEYQIWMISTPTIPRFGVNIYYKQSTESQYAFKCPHCSKSIMLRYPDSLIITGDDINDPNIANSHLICTECKTPLDHTQKHVFLQTGQWVDTYTNRDYKGYCITQLYSSTVHPSVIAKSHFKALTDPTEEQELYNSKLGEPHIVKDASLNDDDIEAVIKDYRNLTPPTSLGIHTMGVDVGKYLHVTIDKYVQKGIKADCRTLAVLKVERFEDLYDLMRKYRIVMCVIDANPERRKALEFAQTFPGHVKLCFYGRSQQQRTIHVNDNDDDFYSSEFTVTVDRTSWIDLALSRFRDHTISLPCDVPEEYKLHMKNIVRVYKKDMNGNPVGSYINTDDDHYVHSRTYSEIAYPLACSLARSIDMNGVM